MENKTITINLQVKFHVCGTIWCTSRNSEVCKERNKSNERWQSSESCAHGVHASNQPCAPSSTTLLCWERYDTWTLRAARVNVRREARHRSTPYITPLVL